MTQAQNQTTPDTSAGIEILRMPDELDLLTADGLVEQGRAAIARHARLLLLDLTELSFCDARGLSALVRIANHADAAGCRYRLIAPRPPVAKVLRISGLNERLPVFATTDDALSDLTAIVRPVRGKQPSRKAIAQPLLVSGRARQPGQYLSMRSPLGEGRSCQLGLI